jgi:phosphoribosylanthranilate isomerase
VSVRVKICGLKTDDALDAALGAGADMIGLVFFPRSPRHLELEAAAALAGRARGRAEIVAVTVDPDDDLIAALRRELRPDYVQLHGSETPARGAAVRLRSGARLIKAVRVADASDIRAAAGWDGVADLILYDAAPPKDATLPGGNGLSFDWRLLAGAGSGYVLSGGLDPDNVGEAVDRLAPFAVDVSSGVESAPGVKDPDKIARFVAAAKRNTAEGT